jgi:hypothetical protein
LKKTFQWLGYGYEMTRRVLRDKLYVNNSRSPENALVVIYHSSVEEESGEVYKSHVSSMCASIIYICLTRTHIQEQVI